MATTSRGERYLPARLQHIVIQGAADRAVGRGCGHIRDADQGGHRHARPDVRSALLTLGMAIEEEGPEDGCGCELVCVHGYSVTALELGDMAQRSLSNLQMWASRP